MPTFYALDKDILSKTKLTPLHVLIRHNIENKLIEPDADVKTKTPVYIKTFN